MFNNSSTEASSSKEKIAPVFEITSAHIAETEGKNTLFILYRYDMLQESMIQDLPYWNDIELNVVKNYLKEKDFILAAPLLENNFRLLNKVYTDRSPPVILALCRLLGCCISMPGSPGAEKWADLALHRYEGVCDSDLLELYLPLLQVCNKIWWQTGRNRELLEMRLQNLRQQGIKFNETINLLEAVDALETKLSSIS